MIHQDKEISDESQCETPQGVDSQDDDDNMILNGVDTIMDPDHSRMNTGEEFDLDGIDEDLEIFGEDEPTETLR